MATKTSGPNAGTEVLDAAQRGFAAFGAAQEMTMKALLRAATRQAELTQETMSDCFSAAAAIHLPKDAEDGQEQLRRAGDAAEGWFRTWRSIADDLRHDLFEAADVMLAGAPIAAPAPAAALRVNPAPSRKRPKRR